MDIQSEERKAGCTWELRGYQEEITGKETALFSECLSSHKPRSVINCTDIHRRKKGPMKQKYEHNVDDKSVHLQLDHNNLVNLHFLISKLTT